ncbi:hypothetical protein SBV1_40012 [Verrucomicrobia bacterium]|nr:hypothetical protein SBV1_40012 [Verrucomicrobiota bacterium]
MMEMKKRLAKAFYEQGNQRDCQLSDW